MTTKGFICNYKGVACTHATMDGYCTISGCVYIPTPPNSVLSQISLPKIDTLPDELTINGVKYRRVAE